MIDEHEVPRATFELTRRAFARHTHGRRLVGRDLRLCRALTAQCAGLLDAFAEADRVARAQVVALMRSECLRIEGASADDMLRRSAAEIWERRARVVRVQVLTPQPLATRRLETYDGLIALLGDALAFRHALGDTGGAIDKTLGVIQSLERERVAVARRREKLHVVRFRELLAAEAVEAVEAARAAHAAGRRDAIARLALDRAFDAQQQVVALGDPELARAVTSLVLEATRQLGPEAAAHTPR